MVGKKWGAPSRAARDRWHMTTVSHALNRKLRMNPRPPKQFWLKRLRAHWGATLDALIPMGYEDNAGFHHGSEPAMSSNPQSRQRIAK